MSRTLQEVIHIKYKVLLQEWLNKNKLLYFNSWAKFRLLQISTVRNSSSIFENERFPNPQNNIKKQLQRNALVNISLRT